MVAEVDPRNNLPTLMAYRYNNEMAKSQALQSTVSTVDAANINLSEPEMEFLRWHCRLGHISLRRVQFLMRSGVLSNSESIRQLHTAACKLASPPKCAACQYGKQTRRPSPEPRQPLFKIELVSSKEIISCPVSACQLTTLCVLRRVGYKVKRKDRGQ